MSNNILAVHRGEDGKYNIAWAGGIPLCVGASRGEAIAELRINTELTEAEIAEALNSATASASTFLSTALAGTANEVDSLAEAVASLPTTDTVAKVAMQIETVADTVATLADSVTRQEKQNELRILETQSDAALQRKFVALASEGIDLTTDERATILRDHYANNPVAQKVMALRTELAK